MTKKLGSDQEEIVVNGDTIEGVSEDISSIQEVIDDELNAMFAEFGGDDIDAEFRIFVKRVMPGKGKLEHCFAALPSELPILDRIREHYGPGEYQISVYNKNRLRKRRSLNIAKPIKKIALEQPQPQQQDISTLLTTMMEQQREDRRQLQELLSRQAPAVQSNPMEMVGAIMGAMVQMKDFMQPTQSGPDATAMFIKGLELAKDLSGESEGRNFNDVVVSLGKELLPGLVTMAKTEQQANAQRIAKFGPNPEVPSAALQSPESNSTQPTEGQPMQPVEPTPEQLAFKQNVDMLVIKAQANSDVQLWADLIIDSVPTDQIKAFIARPDAIDYLAQFNPEVKTYAGWFTSLKEELEGILAESSESVNLTGEPESAKQEKITDNPETGVGEIIDAAEHATGNGSESSQDT